MNGMERFGIYSDVKRSYTRGGVDVTFRDYEIREATPETVALIAAFCEKYEFLITRTRFIYTDDNDEIGTGTSETVIQRREIGDDCIFLLYEGRIVGVAYPECTNDMPVAWFYEEDPESRIPSSDYSFCEKEKN